MSVGITSFGTYIPKRRVKISEIAALWDKDGEALEKSLGLEEKAVPAIDEDTVTISVESAFNALIDGQIALDQIGALIIGSESHPYAVKPTSTTVGEILGLPQNYLSVDTQFACKAGTAGMQLIAGLVESKKIKYGLAIGADTAQAKPGDPLEYTAASAAAAFVLGKRGIIAKLIDFTSYSSNTPDFWRRDGQKYPSHGGRFTGEPAYFEHTIKASTDLLNKTKLESQDFDFVVFHMPNGKFPKEVAKRLGFTGKQLEGGFIVDRIGNPYSASSMVGLAAVLEQAKAGQKIFVCSYGSGAGADSFVFETTPLLSGFQKRQNQTVVKQIENKKSISYPEFVKDFKRKEYL